MDLITKLPEEHLKWNVMRYCVTNPHGEGTAELIKNGWAYAENFQHWYFNYQKNGEDEHITMMPSRSIDLDIKLRNKCKELFGHRDYDNLSFEEQDILQWEYNP